MLGKGGGDLFLRNPRNSSKKNFFF